MWGERALCPGRPPWLALSLGFVLCDKVLAWTRWHLSSQIHPPTPPTHTFKNQPPFAT